MLTASKLAFSQTITIGNLDPGPYGQSSTISVPISITSAGCLQTNNVFNLYLSDANGSFANERQIGSYSGFYTGFINGTIPSIPAGTGYKVRIKTTSPATIPVVESSPFTILGVPGATASVSSSSINAANPEVFGVCIGDDSKLTDFTFINRSGTGAVTTISFFNEVTKATELTTSLATNVTFQAKAVNYTVTVKAIGLNGALSTKSYLLMNNPVNNSFGASGSTTVCLSGGNALTYNVDITSANGIQKNYPGLTYLVKWGDGATSTLTFCEIAAKNGEISHVYTRSSCGNLVNGQRNVFEVDLQPISPYCASVVTQVTGYAKVLAPPLNQFSMPASGCVNTQITINNTSIPGQDPNSSSSTCNNVTGLYTWLVDGVVVENNKPITEPFKYTFNAIGIHNVTLRLQNSGGLCSTPDVTKQICIKVPPIPSFTLPLTTICTGTPLTPVNTSVNLASCTPANPYRWVVTASSGGTSVSFGNGTNASSDNPEFIFNTPGVYQVRLEILTPGCGTPTTPPQTVVVNATPIASLSPDVSLCGNNRVFTFDTNPGVTRAILANTVQDLPTTYQWTFTGGNFTYEGGTGPNSRFPQVKFLDYATYTVNVVHTNNCGVATASQVISFQPAPTVSAGPDQVICEGGQAVLTGSVSGTFTTQQWIGGTGTFIPNRNVLNPNYIPSAAEITAGQALLTLRVTTALAAPCNSIDDVVVIAITRKDNITSPSTLEACTAQPFTYNITSSNALTTYSWTATLTSGIAAGFQPAGSGNKINDIITNTSGADAIVTYIITPVTNGCTGNPFTLRATVKPIPASSASVANPLICSNQPAGISMSSNISGVTYTWTSVASTGVSGNSNQSVPTGNAVINDLLINTGTTVGTVTYTISPLNGTCGVAPITATVTVQPAPVTSVPGADAQICNSPTYTLQGNNPAPGTGRWSLVSGQTGVTFSDATKPNAVVTGLIAGNVYQFKWSITASPTCPPSENIVTITDAAETIAGTLAGNATVCSGINAGQVMLSGQLGNVLRWESSVNGGTSWLPVANSTATLNYLNLTTTTLYRAVVQNSACSFKISNAVTITVNQQAITANAGADFTACAATTITLNGNSPSPFLGMWTQTGGPAASVTNPANFSTTVTGLVAGTIYKFTWTIKGTLPCADNSDEVVVTNTNDVVAGFTADKSNGCGAQVVTFTNTSSVITGTNFIWDFGDGSVQSTRVNPQHTFLPRTDGREAVYTVSLSISNNCVQRPPVTYTVKVSPAVPVAAIVPDDLNGCGAFVLNVQNPSPGNNAKYDFYLYKGATLVQQITKTDKSAATFNAITVPAVTTYRLYMVVTDVCGTTARTIDIPITISPASFIPQMFIRDNVNKGCAPFNVVFVNNSSGGDSFSYNIYDAANKIIESVPAGKSDFPYTFTLPGVYFVSLTGTDYCTTLESSPKIRLEVYTTPAPDFKPDIAEGCKRFTVKFANLTPKDNITPASSLIYEWSFGDGTREVAFIPSPHLYDFKISPYNVTLTVTNLATGCTNTVTKNNLITVHPPPGTNFTARPDTIAEIPNYHFAFKDLTTGNPLSWSWTFGDGSSSNMKNPEHTYADTGVYKVTLKTINSLGCDSTITHRVQIKGVPGQLYMPNAFTPDGLSGELRSFTVKGSGIAKWTLQIYNNWGQLVWQTYKLSPKGEPVESWDGTFKGSPAPQGVYVWQASATFINGTEWKGMTYNSSVPKRTGAIHLIR
ncbi:PKD domain-containing protein [Mucilaginibacter sp.]|uniref:PKD domain-containing protein n=1 Tax=Mucilaginibacter sp. TaxID=1882438 RepID=UPI0035BC1B67